ncbi:hypothetical protein GCK32_011851, partial [Trichostrongylus colubriformis]
RSNKIFDRNKPNHIFGRLEDKVDLVKVIRKYEAKKTDNEAKMVCDNSIFLQYQLPATGYTAPIQEKNAELATSILAIGCRDKVIENTVTKEDDQLLAQFFSGKTPCSPAIKSALLQAMLTNPNLLPPSWVEGQQSKELPWTPHPTSKQINEEMAQVKHPSHSCKLSENT